MEATNNDSMNRSNAGAIDYDVLVIGAGIAGEESALKLADMGFKVLLIEKEP